MISHTRKELFILADHTKVKKREAQENSYGSCVYDRPCTLITDDNADMMVLEKLKKNGINVIIVPTK
jgi:DeoR/GlpR family transcriptional regulator of sugar metabolism